MSKQTAVNWLVKQIKSKKNQKTFSAEQWLEVIEQAKQMEEEQLFKSFVAGMLSMEEGGKDYLQYIKQTYGQE